MAISTLTIQRLCRGEYVGDPDWNTQLASFKEGTTSVNRVLLSILGPFANIQVLGTQQGGVIYNN